MTSVSWARVVAAALLGVSAGAALADEPAAPAAAAARPTGSGVSAGASAAGVAEPRAKKPPPAVLVVPLLGIVVLPVTLPVTQPRVREIAPTPASSSGAPR